MIQRLGSSSLNFKANEIVSARDAYNDKMNSNVQIAQKQNDIVSNVAMNSTNNQIAMQGKGQKLDVIV